ncbi:MAG: PEP-CTERM sorting domain-containing protein [Gemmatimonadota bacterium]
MKKALFLSLGLAIALSPATANAQIFNGTPLPLEYLDFVGGSGVGSTYGVQVGPYTAHFEANGITGRTTASPQFSVYCVDYLHYASNSNGLVTVNAIGGDLTNTRLGDFGRYQRSAYLSSLFDSWQDHETALETMFAGTNFSRNHVWGGLHSLIWDTATGPGNLGDNNERTWAARNYFASLADDNAGSYDTTGWYVLSEADVPLGHSYSGQEFLMRTVEVPEPSTVLLMLTGIGLLAFASRRRFADIV